jgi:tRNA nucleotidyltransferase (CCA-adding enzyme)
MRLYNKTGMCAREANLIDKLSRATPPEIARLLRDAIAEADAAKASAYLVGGPVRDLLLGRNFHNADISIEGDAIALAESLAAQGRLRVVRHPRFGTATIRSGDFVLDFVSARSEMYDQPGALPNVSRGTIDDDLQRRDFTVNAIALALNGDRAGELIDPLGGRADVRRKTIRVLHERSFQDDATRILRAARYEQRLGFRLGARTEQWLLRDVGYLETISPARIHHELARTFDEPEPELTLLRLSELGALTAIHTALVFGREQATAMGAVRSLDRRAARAACWPIFCWYAAESPGIASRLALRRPQAEAVAAVPQLRRVESRLAAAALASSRVVDALALFPLSAVWALAAMTGSELVRERAVDYLRRLRRVRPNLNGDDVIALGARQGPRVGEILRRLKTAKLDGHVRTRADEEKMARELIDRLS